MERAFKQIETETLNLPLHLRARLAKELISSLDEELRIEEAWLNEAERRSEELQTGKVQGVPAEEVFERARRRYS